MKKIVECMKCKKKINVEVDKLWVPYQKICSNCKKLYSRTERGVAKGY